MERTSFSAPLWETNIAPSPTARSETDSLWPFSRTTVEAS